MSKEEKSSKKSESKMNKKRNHGKAHCNHFENGTSEQISSRKFKHKKPGKHLRVASDDFSIKLHERTRSQIPSAVNSPSKGHATPLRKRVDPETAKYFLEISNLFESNGLDLDVRPTVCGNALEETRGKEVQLASDMIISRTLQCLLEGCDLEKLCSFLRSSAEDFPTMAVDKFGSHVAETALKSLAMHLQEDQSYSMVEETLHKICQVVGADAVNIICNIYGSHVLRSLLCLCMGVPLGALEEFHVTKRSSVLAERLNSKPGQPGGSVVRNPQNSFPDTFKFLVQEILNNAKDEISTLRAEKYSSLVLQSLLKLLVVDDQVLVHTIMILLGCQEENFVENKFTDATKQKLKGEVLGMLEDTASSHLIEVIVEVAPEALYNELLDVIFKGSLLEISSHQFGNFVAQAVISSARTKEQANLIWEELGPYLCQLLEAGKPGVVASILATCQRLQTHVNEFCQELSVAVCPEAESPTCIVPHLLHLDSYFRYKSHWKWPLGDKMHVLGCLMLQSLFKISNSAVRLYFESLSCMEADHVLETAKDVRGGRVLEAFLCSEAPVKQKLKVIAKLQGFFGEVSLHSSGSFTVEKCFTASNISMREAIAAELLNVQPELSMTKHGPYLLRKLDIEGFGRNPEQWKSSQESKETTYRDFLAAFGDKDQATIAPEFLPKDSQKKRRRQENITGHNNSRIENYSSPITLRFGKEGLSYGGKHGNNRKSSSGSHAVKFLSGRSFARNSIKPAMQSNKTKSSTSELADLALKSKLSSSDVQKLFDPKTLGDKKQHAIPFLRKPNKR
ncbi:pumilio homolog 23 isoform X1 [Dendrobium catenatum]|uniref:Pumilio like 23 n=1 Tax=Dendrobium catenatum TaxID=906689 RepID=A0A2I0VB74_9ASPA|nr:pumilio homolog 23 isoform X1 [Dendrobium catenatum]PKU60664.1 Pumilio like 23 [Dendrobium catenatum]